MLQDDGAQLRAFLERRDERAFEDVVNRHARMVFGTCLRILGQAQDAQDCAQAAFLALAHKAAGLTGQANVGPWLHQVAHHVAVNALQQRAAQKAREEEVVRMDTPATLSEADRAAFRQALDDELSRLPENQRRAVVLCHLEGCSLEEAARILKCPVPTVGTWLSRAREKLRQRFARRGLLLTLGVLTGLLATEAQAAEVPAGLVAASVKAGLAATGPLAAGAAGAGVSPHVAALTKGVLNAMFYAKLKVAAAVLAAVTLASGGLGYTIHRTLAGEPAKPLAQPAPDGGGATASPPGKPALSEQPILIPKGGALATSVPLPNQWPWVTQLLWTRDGKQIVVVIDNAIKENNGSISKQGPDENDIHAVDLETGKIRKVFSRASTPQTVAGNRLLVSVDEKLYLIEDLGSGARKELPGKQWYYARVSTDGKYIAYLSGAMGESYETVPLRLATADGDVKELQPPADAPPAAGLKLHRSLRYWTPEGRLFLASTWLKEGESSARATWAYWLYDAETNSFEKTEALPLSGPPRSRAGWTKIRRHDGSWVAVTPEPKFTRPVWKAPPGGAAPGGGPAGDVVVENASEALVFTDASGKVLRQVELDRQALAGASLHVHNASADGRYLLVSTFTTVQYMSGMPFSKLLKTFLVDTQTGKFLPKFEIPSAEYGLRHAFTAVMSASRQVLVVSPSKGQPAGFLWCFPFDGGAPREASADLRLPLSAMDYENTRAFGDLDWQQSRRLDPDRLVLGVTPRNWSNIQDPRYQTEPRRLLVFWNSAQPLAAFASNGRRDQPRNVTWSPDGSRFAFTAGRVLHVWAPTGTAGPPGGPAPPAEPDVAVRARVVMGTDDKALAANVEEWIAQAAAKAGSPKVVFKTGWQELDDQVRAFYAPVTGGWLIRGKVEKQGNAFLVHLDGQNMNPISQPLELGERKLLQLTSRVDALNTFVALEALLRGPPTPHVTTGRIAALEKDKLTLHVLRGPSGIMRPVLLDEKTEVVLSGGNPSTLADLKVDQWVRVTMDEKWEKALRIEPAQPPWQNPPAAVGTLTGRVQDHRGTPVAGATITVYGPVNKPHAVEDVVARGVSGADGTFRIENVPASDKIVFNVAGASGGGGSYWGVQNAVVKAGETTNVGAVTVVHRPAGIK